MGQLASLVYSSPKEDLVAHVNENPMNTVQVLALVTQSRKILKNRTMPDKADGSIKRSVGVVYDVSVMVDKFVFPTDFVVLNCEIDIIILIIISRPFLAMRETLVDVDNGDLKFRANEEELSFNIHKSMKYPSDMHVMLHLEQIDKAVTSIGEAKYSGESFTVVLLLYD
ncbi:hypothetical protein MTR67_052338 [Solanum verrucosum]|uniref:Uncharacterized protein n=1 Tax=Solanum verrucosum TaxID=315347 RepID=A0AAF1A2T3_SOLVR|nr:hypothetical protein MTR67_052338 [Solanum verrucosum]